MQPAPSVTAPRKPPSGHSVRATARTWIWAAGSTATTAFLPSDRTMKKSWTIILNRRVDPERIMSYTPFPQRVFHLKPGAQVAQLVEHATENRSVTGSIPVLGTIYPLKFDETPLQTSYRLVRITKSVTRISPVPTLRPRPVSCAAGKASIVKARRPSPRNTSMPNGSTITVICSLSP